MPPLTMKDHHHHQVITPPRKRAPPPKLKLLVCFNGAFSRSPPSQKLRYSGGETRIISVDPSVSFSRLKSRIITDVVRAPNGAVSRCSLKYHISESFCFGDGKDGPLLISLETDDDVRSMVEECEAAENLRKRVWVYVFDNHHPTGTVIEGFSGIPAEQGFRWVEGFLREDLVAILRRKGGGNRSKRFGDDCLRKTVLRQQLLAKTFSDQADEQMEIELFSGGDGDYGAPVEDSFSDKSLISWPDHASPVKHSRNPPLNAKGGSLKRELEPFSFEIPILPEPAKLPKIPGDEDQSEDKDHQRMNPTCKKDLDDEEKKDIQLAENRTIMTAISCLKAAGLNLATGQLQDIKNCDLEFIKELGSGNFGTVYHGKWKGSDVAIKQIKSSCFTDKAKEIDRLVTDFWKEAHILGQLRHPNIVAIYGVSSDGDPNSLAAVTEYMVSGSLKKALRRKDGTIDRRKRLILAMDATSGMEYLHEKNVIHFDLKSDNFLVNMKDPLRPVCKIGDLGLSKVKQRSRVSGGVRGTLPWMAPELLKGDSKVSEKVDVYSFGIVMWELLTGEVPHKHMRSEELIGGVIRGDLRPEIPAWCDPAWRLLMERCWSAEPEARPPFSEIAKELRVMANAMKIK